MNKEDTNLVTLRAMGNRELSREPEMVELKRMVRDGELNRDRTVKQLHDAEPRSGRKD